ncbi:uncharacterized protein ASPGLDRAFT_1187256 [Aspergillus glaucus CBS 516.65]|uniref:Uncharacterized protein n=1 Tax=Aspergillus glaucus CBS 516.65 TaxID=1160497 RepID=A0A1L9V4E2_ASPGL|nr:hypothetical protein ASPGLDRAFT_1187256 [Aspergillus glaucus CBS 516.65]OJJ78804.1 hypothetical protein ASPGLDRAFT_1187256 [Aspergillus glaucus CBS 516.65]
MVTPHASTQFLAVSGLTSPSCGFEREQGQRNCGPLICEEEPLSRLDVANKKPILYARPGTTRAWFLSKMASSSFQSSVEQDEQFLNAYKREHFKGSALVRVDNLFFESNLSSQLDDLSDLPRLKRVLENQGVLRLDPIYHVPVLVPIADWGTQVQLREVGGPLPELDIPINYSLRAMKYRNLVTAARGQLVGLNRWWVADIYVDDETGSFMLPDTRQFPCQTPPQPHPLLA